VSDGEGPAASDLATRIRQRRQELGLSREQVAERAGLAASYLAYVEENPRAVVSSRVLGQLATALATTRASLSGGDRARPPGPGRAGPHPVLEALTDEQCRNYLALGGVGRIVFSGPGAPVALPVNFRLHRNSIVFRTSATGALAGTIGTRVGFEVDRVDEAVSEGWSVLVTGQAERLEGGAGSVQELASLEPWAGGERDLYIRIRTESVSGRVIHPGC
jgi:transcriptional regulator with XRE-family HTH domain